MKNTILAIDYKSKKSNKLLHLPISAFKKPESHEEYMRLEKLLDQLIDEVRDDESHPLVLAMQIIGDNLEQYDDEHNPPIGENLSDIDIIKYLIQSYHLQQRDLADIFGSQANVSKFLNGKRSLGKNTISGIKKRFGISADFFI